MANFLGTRYCIESLLHDIKDIEETVGEVNSRVGQVKYQSWKFPDRLSINVDVANLLEEYKYVEDADEEDMQASHVMLYDLLIDRLLFLLQSFTHFNEILLSVDAASDKGGSSNGTKSISAGLTAKRCWGRLTQVASSMQQLAKLVERRTHTSSGPDVSKSIKFASPKESSSPDPSPHVSDKRPDVVSRDVLNRACQTEETSYVNCEICSRTQECLFQVGKSIVKVCKGQGLPTSLEDYIAKQSTSSLLSIAELSRWKNLQTKDLSRIDRHLEALVRKINPLKKELQETRKGQEEDKATMEQMKLISDRKIAELLREQEHHNLKIKEVEKSLRDQITSLKREKQTSQESATALRLELSGMKDELLAKHRSSLAAENERSKLQAESMEGKQYKEDALKMRKELVELRRKTKAGEEELFSMQSKLDKEATRNRTMQSHEQALHEKQQGILRRLSELTEECEEWKERAAMAEEEKDNMVEAIEQERKSRKKVDQEISFDKESAALMEEEKSSMERRIADLQSSIDLLEERLHSCVEREKLLVFYPDLHKSHHLTAVESSGDVATDMRRQVEANQLRVEVLERENEDLMRTLSKLSPPAAEPGESRPQGVQLWKTGRRSLNSNIGGPDDHDVTLQFITGEPHRRPNTRGQLSSPPDPLRHHQHASSAGRPKGGQVSPSRTSFHVGPGKRRSTPNSSRPSSGRSALLKPWT